MRYMIIAALSLGLGACNGGDTSDETTDAATPAETAAIDTAPKPLHMAMLDCGSIEVSDLDAFATSGEFAGQEDLFTDTCWLIHHPDGVLLWDLGLPTPLAGQAAQTTDIFTVSLDQTITEQLAVFNMTPDDIDYVSISHQHFDHTGQVDQVQNATWLVHEAEYASMFPPIDEVDTPEGDTPEPSPYAGFAPLTREMFTGEKDVFGDGTVVIIETPGHTAGHTSLLVNLPEMGPVLLTGDLYHRVESRELRTVPRFNWDVMTPPEGVTPGDITQVSMGNFEARAVAEGARVIIQHDPASIEDLPRPPEALR